MRNWKMMEDSKRPAVGKQWLGEKLEAQLQRHPPPPKGGGDESVHDGSNSKRTSGNCCCFSARHDTHTDSHTCACHSKQKEASMAQ